jgi:hypothetical protein
MPNAEDALLTRITVNPDVFGGKPIIRGANEQVVLTRRAAARWACAKASPTTTAAASGTSRARLRTTA